jgi:hypothetical protein
VEVVVDVLVSVVVWVDVSVVVKVDVCVEKRKKEPPVPTGAMGVAVNTILRTTYLSPRSAEGTELSPA